MQGTHKAPFECNPVFSLCGLGHHLTLLYCPKPSDGHTSGSCGCQVPGTQVSASVTSATRNNACGCHGPLRNPALRGLHPGTRMPLGPTFMPLSMLFPQPRASCPPCSLAWASKIPVLKKSPKDSAWESPELGSLFFSLVLSLSPSLPYTR